MALLSRAVIGTPTHSAPASHTAFGCTADGREWVAVHAEREHRVKR